MIPSSLTVDGRSSELATVTSTPRSATLRVRAGLVAVCLLALGLGAVSIADEGAVSLQGDMPRYLMNGVYVLDLLNDRPFGSAADLIEYTRLYYARYPALSLGHHPILVPVLEAPMFAVFGVSVWSARVLMLVSLAVAVGFLYVLVNELYGLRVALFAAAFFATSPMVLFLTHAVMSEMPTVALNVAGFYYLHRFCATQRKGALAAFVLTAVLSLYARQLAIFVFPAYVFMAAGRLGFKRLLKRDVLLAASVIVIAAAPLVPLTLSLAPMNVFFAVTVRRQLSIGILAAVREAMSAQLSIPVLLLAAAGAVQAIASKDRRSVLFLLWIGSVFVGLILTGILVPARYTIAWVPALCVLAASVGADRRGVIVAPAIALVLLLALGFQARAATRTELVGANGYEEAAQFVVAQDPGATVLFNGNVDTGFFTFFVRKHDPARTLVVLRADKVLTTSRMFRSSVEERIQRPAQIYEILHKFGTRYVVTEDHNMPERVLEWLNQELRTSRFVERKRIPIGTTDVRLRGTDLVIYEFVDRTPADRNTVLDMHLPVVGREVSVRLSDLIDRKYLR